MFFILSKTISLLFMPVPLLTILLLLSIFLKQTNLKRIFAGIFTALFLIFTNPFLVNEVMLWWETPAIPITELDKKYDVAIVLSGITASDKKPDDRVHLHKGADRIMHTVQLYKLGLVKNILVSGGTGKLTGDEITEAERMKRVLLISGVKERDIFLEDKSRNTYENAQESYKVLQKEFPKGDYLLVTSAFHMRRAHACFKSAGLEVTPYSTDFYSADRSFTPDDLLIPSDSAFMSWTRLIREWIGYFVYDFVGYI